MIFTGSGIKEGVKIEGATSLMDLGPTICSLVGAPVAPRCDGVSLVGELTEGKEDKERMVISELGGNIDRKTGKLNYAQMVKKGNLKYVHFDGLGEDAVFDVENDPHEVNNIISGESRFVEEARRFLEEKCEKRETIRERAVMEAENLAITMKCSFDSDERWHAPDSARHYPEEMVSSSVKPKNVNL